MPADSDSLILAMNGGKPMAAKLMYEFSCAAMNQELRRGRSFINRFLTSTYGQDQWTVSEIHQRLAQLRPPYVIDINRDTQLQCCYSDRSHVLINGIARIGGTDFRFKTYRFEGGSYGEIDHTEIQPGEAILFKPMGTPLPAAQYIASDADYVDYLTELMGGFGVPPCLKQYRKGKQYLLIGLPLTRDTERMTLSDLTYAAADPKGWAVMEAPTDKERRFCRRQRIEIIEASMDDVATALRQCTDEPVVL